MATPQGFPLDSPLIDPQTGTLSLAWFQFFAALWNRTGGATGNDSATFKYPQTAGDQGQVLTSEGSGNPTTWTTPVSKVSQLVNDAGYLTQNDVGDFTTTEQTNAAIQDYVITHESISMPVPDGIGSPGFSTRIARADHQHPRESSPTYAGTVTANAFRVRNATWTAGFGSPQFNQPNGSLYSRLDGTTGARLYVSDGSTWRAVAGV